MGHSDEYLERLALEHKYKILKDLEGQLATITLAIIRSTEALEKFGLAGAGFFESQKSVKEPDRSEEE